MILTIHNRLTLAGFLLFSVARALEVSPGSPCSAQCLSSIYANPWSASDSYTNTSDITCSDAAYANTQTGIHFKTCLDCLRTSTRGNLGETDAKWFIYNLRYALDTCLYSKPNPASTAATVPCTADKSCQRLQKSLTNGITEDSQTGTWSYCFADDGAFMGSDRDTCAQCLRKSDDQKYMANYLVALEAGCRQTPEKGTAIGINGTVFSSNTVQVVDPASLNQDPNSGSLPSPAIAGIAVGTGVLCIIAVCLLVVYCQREKRHPRWEDDWYYGQSDMNAQPSISLSVRKRRSHVNYPSEKTAPGSNGNFYDSVESRLRLEQKHNQIVDVSKRTSSVATSETGGLPAHPAYNPYNTPSRKVRGVAPPDLALHRPGRTNTPDSFAEQAYLAAAEDSARIATVKKNSPTTSRHPSNPSPSPTSSRRASSLLSKMGLSPKFGRHQRDRPGLVANSPGSDPQISGPMMVAGNEVRFQDKTLAGPSVYAQHAPPRPPSDYENQYIEVPIKTSENHLYGM